MISVISFLKLQWTLNGAAIIVFSDLQESKGNIGVAIDEMTSLGGLGSCPRSQPVTPKCAWLFQRRGALNFEISGAKLNGTVKVTGSKM